MIYHIIQCIYIYYLVGGLEHLEYCSHHIGNVIIPTDELIFFRGVGIPPTRLRGTQHKSDHVGARGFGFYDFQRETDGQKGLSHQH